MKTKHFLPFAIVALLAIANSTFAQDGQWAKDHPRRSEVNSRLANQHARIDNKEANGKMSTAEASKLHREDHTIRKEERNMASRDNGHITKRDQARLNRQENHVSRQIRRH
jgi:hypothetical protein